MAQALFVTAEDIKKFTALNGNVDPDKFTQFLKIAQDIHIQGYLGTKLFNKINDDIVSGTLSTPYSTLLTTYIKPMVIHWTMVEYLPYAAYIIGNKGIYKHGAENSSNVDKNEIDFLIEKERSTAQHYTRRFIDYIIYNQSSFPEYNRNTNSDMFPNFDADYGGWHI